MTTRWCAIYFRCSRLIFSRGHGTFRAEAAATAEYPRRGIWNRLHCCDMIAPHRGGRTAMRLTPEQLKAFDDEGYLFLPDCFGAYEVPALRLEAEAIYRSY